MSEAADIAERIAALPPAMERKFRAHTVPHPSGCHLWMGYRQPNGYGYVNAGGKKAPAHRLALLLTGVDVPAGMDVCHTCDVRNCVNPQHLYVGTRRQNKPRGAAHWAAKLSAGDVEAIRLRRAAGEPVKALALAFSIHHATVSRVARGIWRQEVI